VFEIREFLLEDGTSPFGNWFHQLDSSVAARVAVGQGVFEYRMRTGAGYRIYFGKEGSSVILLLCGGTKRKQQQDINKAQGYWSIYKNRKKE